MLHTLNQLCVIHFLIFHFFLLFSSLLIIEYEARARRRSPKRAVTVNRHPMHSRVYHLAGVVRVEGGVEISVG